MAKVMALCLGLFVCASVCLAVAPQHFVLSSPVLSEQNGKIMVNLSLTVDSEDGLHDLLKDGAVLELAINLRLERKRLLWANANEKDITYTSFLRHDRLTRDFIITVPEGGGLPKELRDKNLTRLLHSSWRKLALPLISNSMLSGNDPADEYLAIITTTLSHAEVPPWLEKNIIFWSSEVVPKETRTIEFTLPLR